MGVGIQSRGGGRADFRELMERLSEKITFKLRPVRAQREGSRGGEAGARSWATSSVVIPSLNLIYLFFLLLINANLFLYPPQTPCPLG